MSQTIPGTYKNGTISLDHLPEGIAEARVIVEFVDQPARPPEGSTRRRGIAYFGMFAPPDGKFTSDNDLEAAKKAWNPKLDALES